MKKIEIFTDGGCRGNPGPGGYGAILRYNSNEKSISGTELNTTNNRMELTAVIRALEQLNESCEVSITTDSQYVHKGITEWIDKWKKQNWKTSTKTAVKNVDLWQELEKLTHKHKITWHWIRGHNGHRENELADLLVNQALDKLK